MDYKKVDTKELVANVWRPVDYEILDKKGIFTNWMYWDNLTYLEFITDHKAVEWN